MGGQSVTVRMCEGTLRAVFSYPKNIQNKKKHLFLFECVYTPATKNNRGKIKNKNTFFVVVVFLCPKVLCLLVCKHKQKQHGLFCWKVLGVSKDNPGEVGWGANPLPYACVRVHSGLFLVTPKISKTKKNIFFCLNVFTH